MKRTKRTGIGLLLCVLLTLSVLGCSPQKEQNPLNLALLIGNHANAAAPNLTAAVPSVREACESYGYVSMITVDGSPFQSAQADIPVPKKSLSKTKLESIAAEQEKEIMGLAEGSLAKSPEVDTLKAIELGVRALRSREEGTSRMVILDSGVCTAGSLDFTDSLLEAVNPDTVAENLREQGSLPDMRGIEVIWTGLGDTAAPQKPLSANNLEVLKNIWEKVLTMSGAKVEFTSDLPTGSVSTPAELPAVTAVEVLQPVSAVIENGYRPEETVILDQEVLNFRPDSDELLSDTDTLKQLLAPIADYMNKERDYPILLCGTTASAGTQASALELSRQRCDAVKEIFISMGVQEGQIQTLGLGYKDHPFHVDDLNPDGSLNEKLAERNRAVIIVPQKSEIAEKFLN